jgi:hypothetical protein
MRVEPIVDLMEVRDQMPGLSKAPDDTLRMGLIRFFQPRSCRNLQIAANKANEKDCQMSKAEPAFTAAKRTTCVALLAAFVALAPATAAAQSEHVFDGSKARVNLTGKLHSLSQQIGSAGCRLNAGIETEKARNDLLVARSDFAKILDGLENGDTTLGIPIAEKFSRVLNSLRAVRKIWRPVDLASSELIGDPSAKAAAGVLAASNLELLDAVELLSSEMAARYTNPVELLQSDALAMGIAGRQRMFVQRLAKEVCGVATGSRELGTPERLTETINSFERSLIALRDGLPEMGISVPPNDAIKSELQAVYEQWASSKSALEAMAGPLKPEPDNVATVAQFSDRIMKEMNNVVTLYMLSTPGQQDVYRVPLRAYAETELSKWLLNSEMIDAIRAQNLAHANLAQSTIDTLDLEWRAEEKNGGGALIDKLLAQPSSEWLRSQQTSTAGFVTEVFVMDNKGLNVAQSVVTSDYWQGDEAKWKETIGNGSGAVHISEVEFDDSTQFYQSQVSMPIRDPATGDLIGAITFGINVQSLL